MVSWPPALWRLVSRWTALRRIGSSGLRAENLCRGHSRQPRFPSKNQLKYATFCDCSSDGIDRPEIRWHVGGLARAHQERRPARGPLESERPPGGGGGLGNGGGNQPPDR